MCIHQICLHIYKCECIHVCMHVHILVYVCICEDMYLCLHTYVSLYIAVCTCVCVYLCECISVKPFSYENLLESKQLKNFSVNELLDMSKVQKQWHIRN